MFDRIKEVLLSHVTGAPIVADQRGSKIKKKNKDGLVEEVFVPSKFDPDLHKKYHAKYYFQKETGKPIADAERSEKSREAYNDFLEGLEQINCQEYLREDYLGTVKGGKEGEGFIPGLEALGQKVKDVHNFAKWTRNIRTRSSAHTAQQFAKKLKTRAQIGITREPADCKPDMIPVRGETVALLTRPLEPDFTWVGAITYMVQMAIYCYTIYVQLSSIIGVCSGSYMCPFQTKSSGLPVLAPPIIYRDGVSTSVRLDDAILYQSKYTPWLPELVESCILGQPGCDDPGYLIQWPYIEVDTTANDVEFPDELKEKGCTPEYGGQNGWQFDPFLSGGGDLRSEFWDCSAVPNPESIPFISRHSDGNNTVGSTVFHYKPSFYLSNHQATLDCMDQTLPNYGGGSLTRADWNSDAFTDVEKGDMRQEVISCLSGKTLDDSQECACSQHDWTQFALGLYYPGSTPTKTCKGGKQGGQLCVDKTVPGAVFDDGGDDDTVALQCVGGTCEDKFKKQVALNRNFKYGCWFTEATSDSPQLNAVYEPCGLAYSSASDQYASSETLISLQSSIDLVISKRTLLVMVFLIKEGCIFTAMAIVPVLALILLTLLMILTYCIFLPIKLICRCLGMDMDFTINGIVITIKTIIFMQLRILWTMCINFSTIYRVARQGLALFRGLVNPSLRDLDVKLTTVANTVFSLVLLIALADGTVDTAVVTSLCLSLFQLLYAMNTEKIRLQGIAEPFKDLNENRLSKFEFALMLTKVMEDLLEEDVQYNWVQHFNSDQPMKPFDFTFPETLGTSKHNFDDALHVRMPEILTRKKNFEERFDDFLFPQLGEDQDTQIAQKWLAPIPSDLLKFGHDGAAIRRQGESDAAYEKKAKPKTPGNIGQTVEWHDTGREIDKDRIVSVQIVPGKSDLDLLGVPRARTGNADANAFFSQPLFDAGHVAPTTQPGGPGAFMQAGAVFAEPETVPIPPVGYGKSASMRTPAQRNSLTIQEEGEEGPDRV